MPPDEYRNEGTPSLSEGPDARGEPFFAYLFLAFEKKVSRRKGETVSRHNRRNGYVLNQQEPGRPRGRQGLVPSDDVTEGRRSKNPSHSMHNERASAMNDINLKADMLQAMRRLAKSVTIILSLIHI